MKRIVVIASSIAVLSVAAAQAAPDGVPARPRSIGNWTQHDPEKPTGGAEAWTPSDVAGFLQLYPDAFFILGYDDAKPPGITNWKRRATQLAELERIAAARGVDVSGRLCMSERPDVLTRLIDATSPCSPTNDGGGCDWEGDMDGSLGEAETVIKASGLATAGTLNSLVDARADWQPNLWYKRLVVLRPGGPGEERHRVVANDRTGLILDAPWRTPPRTGDRYEVRGSFDPRWVRQVPKRVHEDTVRRFWIEARDVCGAVPCAPPAMPLDPFATANTRGFAPWVERKAIEALRTDSTVPALYGSGYPDKRFSARGERPAGWNDPYFSASGVILDVSNPAYRAWRVRYLLYKLADHGIEPGESTCLSMAYKPGWHTYYDEQTLGPVTGDPCSVSGIHEYTGPAHVCQDGISHGGPFCPTPFGPGEFEEAISNYFRETIATLTASGYKDLRIITSEAPGIRRTTWLILDDDVRRNPKMSGELGSWIEPRLAALASLPPPIARPSTPPVEGSTEPTATPSDTSASAGTAPTSTPVEATNASGGSASSFSLGSGPKTGASAGTESPTDTSYPGTTTTTPVAIEASRGVPSPIAGSGADRGTRDAPPASERRENAARSTPARPGYVTKGSRGGGGTIYAPTFDE